MYYFSWQNRSVVFENLPASGVTSVTGTSLSLILLPNMKVVS